MMQMRQRELRGKHAASGEPFESPTKRSRGEKENTMSPAKSGEGPSSPHKVQGFMAKFAVSPKNPRKNMAAVETNNPNTASSSKTRFSELSKRYMDQQLYFIIIEIIKETACDKKSSAPKCLADILHACIISYEHRFNYLDNLPIPCCFYS